MMMAGGGSVVGRRRRWAVCRCFYERNIFLQDLGHVTFTDMNQFKSDYANQLVNKDMNRILKEIKSEIYRRRGIHRVKEENRLAVKAGYRPVNARLFADPNYFRVGRIEGGLEMLPGVYSFPFLSRAHCNEFLSECDNFKKSGLPFQRPTSMNKSGLLLEEVGLYDQIGRLVEAVQPFAKAKFPELVGDCGLDSFKAFTVEYNAQGSEPCDIERATHFDNAEVTLNIPLTEQHDGSELYFQTKGGFLPVEMNIGRAIMHSGRHQHGVLPITEGYRCNLIVWMRSSQIRNKMCPMCREPPDLDEVEFGHGDGFTIAGNQALTAEGNTGN